MRCLSNWWCVVNAKLRALFGGVVGGKLGTIDSGVIGARDGAFDGWVVSVKLGSIDGAKFICSDTNPLWLYITWIWNDAKMMHSPVCRILWC